MEVFITIGVKLIISFFGLWIREQGYKCIEDIAYAEYKEDGSLYIIPKNKP